MAILLAGFRDRSPDYQLKESGQSEFRLPAFRMLDRRAESRWVRLLDRNALRQISRTVNVAAAVQGDVISQQL